MEVRDRVLEGEDHSGLWDVVGNDVVDTRKRENRIKREEEKGEGANKYGADERKNRARTSCVL